MTRAARTRRALGGLALLLGGGALGACGELDTLRTTWQPVDADSARRVLDGDAAQGRRLVAQAGCTQCHEIPGHRAPAAYVGPSLHRFARRTNIGGSLPNQPEQLLRFIVNAPAELPGTGMPALGLAEADARHIAAYLYQLH